MSVSLNTKLLVVTAFNLNPNMYLQIDVVIVRNETNTFSIFGL